MNDSRTIVITSINAPTTAVDAYGQLDGWDVVVVGDRKTPQDWRSSNVTFIPYAAPADSSSTFERLLPVDHYSRKMLGYLRAMENNATVIVDADDDNTPYPGWDWPDFSGPFRTTPKERGFVNVYRSFTDQHIWPRGFPLKRIQDPQAVLSPGDATVAEAHVGIWQGLADGDPDVDAIYRLTIGSACTFENLEPIVLSEGTLCPFNSQNTAFKKEFFPLLYLPASVPFRFTDILRGLVAQPLLWRSSHLLGFAKATVFQDRNPHDYLADFESEIPCYLYPDTVIELVTGAIKGDSPLCDNLLRAYESLVQARIVPPEEMPLLKAWIDEVKKIRPGRSPEPAPPSPDAGSSADR